MRSAALTGGPLLVAQIARLQASGQRRRDLTSEWRNHPAILRFGDVLMGRLKSGFSDGVATTPCSIYSIAVYYSNGALPMTQYSTSDLSRKSGDIIAEALRRPVTITQRNKPRLVLLSIEDYRRLTAKADTRKAGRLETMPDDLFEDFKQAVAAY